MKTLFTILLAVLCLSLNAQSLKVHLSGYYSTDTTLKQTLSVANDWVKITTYHVAGGYFDATYNNKPVYVPYVSVFQTPDFEKYVTKNVLDPLNSKFDKEHYGALITKYGKRIAYTIAAKKVTLGMNMNMVSDAWGKPDDVTKSVSDGVGTSYMWIYNVNDTKKKYVFFLDGRVTGYDE